MTVADLIAALSEMDENAEVKIAHQPGWPMENTIYEVVEVEGGVYIAAEDNNTYLDSAANELLKDEGWGL